MGVAAVQRHLVADLERQQPGAALLHHPAAADPAERAITQAAPTDGWPAKGSSVDGVKIRSR